ncbi:MAG: hypothetical protein JWM12_2738 [Ilumatobacteraceae bacterium]|nr:hypothetical protein [Ilumatobacteraceae bacterium]
MSQRHRSQEAVPPPKMDLRAHAHNERHRIHCELNAVAAQVSGGGYQPDEVHEPGRAWVPAHHHDAERGKASVGHGRKRHWKMKMWKRRSSLRQAKAKLVRLAAEQA